MILKASRGWLVILFIGAGFLFACRKPGAAQSGDVKAQIAEHLVRKSGQKHFAPGMDLDLAGRVSGLQSNVTALERRFNEVRTSLRTVEGDSPASKEKRVAHEAQLQATEREWESARAEFSRKREELSRQEDTYIRSMRQRISDARTYETIYQLVGEQLATADRLLAETNRARRRLGLKMAREACGHVNSGSVDVWLAARICEAYFWPNLDLADSEPGSRERALDLLETARRVFFDTYETNNVVKNYELLLANAPNARAADTFRVQLADWLEEKGSIRRAAEILSEIRDAQVLASAEERITRVRERAAMMP